MRGDERVFVGLGANLGDAVSTLRTALARLDVMPETAVVATSSMYRTAPVDATGPDFINAVAELRTGLAPETLLAQMMTIEQGFGRQRLLRNAPRSLDLDLLLFGEREIHTDQLCVPHPRMWQRAFVLAPLSELVPGMVGADGRNILDWLEGLADQQIERIEGPTRRTDA